MLVMGLSSDTKPSSPPSTWVFLEYDTGKIYNSESSAWVEKLNESYAEAGEGGGGTGDVEGPASATNNHVVFFDGATGKLIKDSGLGLSGVNTGDQTSVTGNAGTATALQNSRNINGVGFDGTANITVPAAGSTLTDAVPNSNLANMAQKTYKGRTTASTGAPEDVAVATLKADLGLVKADVGLGSVDNTSDANKPVSTAQQTALDLKANIASPTFTGTPAAPTRSQGDNGTSIATTAFVTAINNNSSYRILLYANASMAAGRTAGVYMMAAGNPATKSGNGTTFPLNLIYLAAADYPTIDTKTTKLRIRAMLHTNDTAPTGNYTFGLYPVTRPGTSGAVSNCIFDAGTVVAGSNGAAFTTPAADQSLTAVSSDFDFPADGFYVLAVLTTETTATNSHLHLQAQLQMRNA